MLQEQTSYRLHWRLSTWHRCSALPSAAERFAVSCGSSSPATKPQQSQAFTTRIYAIFSCFICDITFICKYNNDFKAPFYLAIGFLKSKDGVMTETDLNHRGKRMIVLNWELFLSVSINCFVSTILTQNVNGNLQMAFNMLHM